MLLLFLLGLVSLPSFWLYAFPFALVRLLLETATKGAALRPEFAKLCLRLGEVASNDKGLEKLLQEGVLDVDTARLLNTLQRAEKILFAKKTPAHVNCLRDGVILPEQ